MPQSLKMTLFLFLTFATLGSVAQADIFSESSRELRQYRNQLERQTQLAQNVSQRLRACQRRTTSPRPPRRDDLARENRQLRRENSQLQNQVYRLEREIDRLRPGRRGPRPGEFDLVTSMRACGKIRNSYYANACIEDAKEYRINAETIKSCAVGISNTAYAANCVQNAGQYNANEFQTRACVKISNSFYAAECVKDAGQNGVPEDVILACLQASNNTARQAQCVANM